MNINSIFNAGGKIIENPDWSPSDPSSPKYISIADDNTNETESNLLAQTAYRTAASGRQDVLGTAEELDKYVKNGVTPNDFSNLDAELADAQSNWTKAGNALAQTVVSELGLGTVKAGFDIFDFIASNILHVTDDDYQNPVSNTIAEWQEEFKNNIAPIYVTPGVNIQNGGLKDWGWWYSNIPTIASSLTLLLPTKGITAGVNALGRLGKAGKFGQAGKFLSNGGHSVTKARKWFTGVEDIEEANKLSKFQSFVNNPITIARANYAAKTVAEATLMRTMENYGEARETYIPVYQEASDKLNSMDKEAYDAWLKANPDLTKQLKDKDIDIYDKDSIAKYIAEKAADRTFAMDWSNIVWDVIQLHGLNNIGKGIKKATGRAVRETQKQSVNAAEEFATGTVKTASKTPWYKTVGYTAVELGRDGGKLVLQEGNEAIEEAVNYIAAQEGLSYGKALLDGKEDTYGKSKVPGVIDSWRYMQGDLSDYVRSAELQESAFWGLMGGVTFGVLGGGFNKAQLALHRKANQKARETNPITGEKINIGDGSGNPINSWAELLELPETHAAREAINRRQVRLSQVADDLKAIENNVDIFGERDEAGQFKQFTGSKDIVDLKKEMARQEVINNFISDIAMDAMNSGTFDLLLDYFQNEKVKQAMVKAGLNGSDNINAFTENVVKQLNEVKEEYARQSAHVLNQVTSFNASRKNKQDVPLPYVQIIAKQNMDRIQAIKGINKQINALELIATDQANIDEKTKDSLFNGAREAVSLGMLVDMYGRLSADEREIQNTEATTGREKLKKAKALEDIKAKKEAIIGQIKKTTINNQQLGSSALFYAFKNASGYVKEGNKYRVKEQIEQTDEDILKDVKRWFGDDVEESDDTIIHMANKINSDFEQITGEQGLANVNAALFNTFATLTKLNLEKAIHQSQIVSSKDQIANRIDYLHNSMNQARLDLLAKATDTIVKAYSQYNNNDKLIDSIINAYNGNKQRARELAESAMASVSNRKGFVTASEFIDALDIFNFGSDANKSLFSILSNIIDEASIRSEREKENAVVNSSTIQQANTGTENLEVDNSTQSSQSFDTEQLMQPYEQVSQSILNQIPKHGKIINRHNIKIIFNNQGDIVEIRPSNTKTNAYTAYEFEDGTVQLDVEALPKNTQLKFITAGAFEISDDIDLLNVNTTWKIEENPEIERNRKVWEIKNLGTIVEINKEESRTPVEERDTATLNTAPSLTQPQETQPPIVPQPANPSTGVLDKQDEVIPPSSDSVTPVKTHTPKVAPVNFDEAQIKLESVVGQAFGEFVSDPFDDSVDINEVAAKVKENLIDKPKAEGATLNFDEADIIKAINNYVNEVNQLKNDFGNADALNKTAAGLSMAAVREEVGNTINFSSFFTNTVEAFMQEYKKVVVVPVVNGKQVVSLEEILRICKNLYPTSDDKLSRHLYEVIKAYLNSPYGKASYLVTDLEEDILTNITKSLDKIQEENDSRNIGTFRVNIVRFMEMAEASNPSIREAYYDALDNLNIGDDVEIINDEKEILIVKDNITIGSMVKPVIKGSSYVCPVEDWIIDIALDANGMPKGQIVDIMLDIFTNNSSNHESLRELLLDISTHYSKKDLNSAVINKNYIQKFERNPIILGLYTSSKANAASKTNILQVDDKTGEIDSQKVLKHLIKLYRYATSITKKGNKNSNIIQIKASINRFYKILYNTWDATSNIKSNTKAKVSKISEGQILRVVDDIDDKGYDKLPLANKAIADPANAKIGIVDPIDRKFVFVSSKGGLPITGWSGASTILALFSRNEEPDFVKAWGVKLSDKSIKDKDSEFNAIKKAVKLAIKNALITTMNNADKNPIAIINILKSVIHSNDTNNRISLFRTITGSLIIGSLKGAHGEKGVSITYTFPKTSSSATRELRFNIFTSSMYKGFGYSFNGKSNIMREPTIALCDEIVEEFMKFIEPIANINISKLGIRLDSIANQQLEGFITKENGKIIIDIPTEGTNRYHKEFDSYNDFLIQSGLIKVNTKKGKNGKNFTRRGRNQQANKNLYITLPKPKVSTNKSKAVKESNEKAEEDAKLVASKSRASVYSEVRNIIETNRTNCGVAIFEHILGKEEYDKFAKILDEFTLLDTILPDNMYYDPEINEGNKGDIAYSNPGGRYPTYKRIKNGEQVSATFKVGERLVVGSRFMNMASSIYKKKRQEAIRKLIHEKIHLILGETPNIKDKLLPSDENTISPLQEIYDIFKNNAEKDIEEWENNPEREEQLKVLKNIVYGLRNYQGNRLLEEFLVESLTSEDMYKYLNSIKVKTTDNKKKDNLFTKLIKAIAKFFNWDKINDDSLLMHELNVLRDTLDIGNNPKEKESTDKIKDENKKEVKENQNKEKTNERKDEVPEGVPEGFNLDTKDSNNIPEGFDLNIKDNDSYMSAIEEINTDEKKFDTKNIEAFRDRLPKELHSKFDTMRQRGEIEIVCH